MPKPKKNLIDSFMSGLMEDAKNAVDSVTNIDASKPKESSSQNAPFKEQKPQEHIRIISGTEQNQRNNSDVSDNYHVTISDLSDKEHIQRSSKDHQSINNKQRSKKITNVSPSGSLSKSQTLVFLWFKRKGKNGLFNKPEIVRDLSMPYITIRKAIKKLELIGLLELSYDTCQKYYEYNLKPSENIKLSRNITLGSVSYQNQDNKLTSSLNSSSSLLNKTTTMDNQSEIELYISEILETDPEYTYWTEQKVTPMQVIGWKNKFGIDLQTILNNLCYVRWQIIKQGVKVNKSATGLLYTIMEKNGGTVNQPAGYKPMAQLDLEFYENWKKQKIENMQKIVAVKQETLQAEIEPKVNALLSSPDLENEYIKEALGKIYSTTRKNAIISRIKNGSQLDSKEKASLKRCLEDVLIKKTGEGR